MRSRSLLVIFFTFILLLLACTNVFASEVTLKSAMLDDNGKLYITGSVDTLKSDQQLSITVCPYTSSVCDLDNIVYIDQQTLTEKNFTLVFPLVLDDGTYAARIGGNGINTPKYIIIQHSGSEYEIKLGDVDENGAIEAADASIVLQYVLNKAACSLTEAQLKRAKVTVGDEITAEDASWILQKALVNSVLFPAETN